MQSAAADTGQKAGQFPHIIRVRVSQDEHARLVKAAALAGMRLGSYARHKLTGAHVSARIDVQMLNELRRQGGLLKMLAIHGQPTAEALDEVIRTMRTIQASI